jgi:hypothetical protein
MVRELEDELLADHPGRAEYPDVDFFHRSTPLETKTPACEAGRRVVDSSSSDVEYQERIHTTGLPDRLARLRTVVVVTPLMSRCSIPIAAGGSQF